MEGLCRYMKKILVLINDAGGSELLSSMIFEERDRYVWNVVVPRKSPAHSIFMKKGLKNCLTLFNPNEIELSDFNAFPCDVIIYNPGWNAYPINILNKLTRKGKTIAILDNWVDYRERFGYPAKDWRDNLPDFIIVCDNKAYDLACEYDLPNVVRLKNYYLSEQLNQFQALAEKRNDSTDTLLFLSQTVNHTQVRRSYKGNFTYVGYYEKDAIAEIVNNFDHLVKHFGIRNIRIRLHPSEKKIRYRNILDRLQGLKIKVEHSNDCELLESISNSQVVIGMTSIALFTSYICGKPTFSFIPEKSVKCPLPLPPEICVRSVSEICRTPFEDSIKHENEIDFFLERNFNGLFMEIEKG